MGAEATRRMNRLADAPTPLGDRGPREEGVGTTKDAWEEAAVYGCAGKAAGGLRPRPRLRCFSDFVRCLEADEKGSGSSMGGRAWVE